MDQSAVESRERFQFPDLLDSSSLSTPLITLRPIRARKRASSDTSSATLSNEQLANQNSPKRTKTTHNAKQSMVPDGPTVSPTLTPALPEPIPPATTTVATPDELAFFDRAKKFIANKNNMNEFLKLCNLFSQDLIDKSLLLTRAQSFIGGNPELFAWFKNFLGYEPETNVTQTKAKTVSGRVSLSNCRGLGPSYRLLPKRVSFFPSCTVKYVFLHQTSNLPGYRLMPLQERERPCSGRDQLCKSVLNDEWASHPTWASEDSGFVAHRKNQYEEGLHRIEEERHDYDFNIEACLRTIQQLEPIAQQILQTAPEERLNFVLPAGLGGQSETIYKRVIMKIYGREKGKDVISELFAQPYNVIPILLNRMKQKLEEWKAAQREWEKVWREQTQKIFWKSLDHQSLGAKQADKRQFQLKTLQNEIQVKYEEQRRQLEVQEVQIPNYQFAYSFKDEDVLVDASRLILIYAEHSHSGDYSKVISFIKEFVPLFFGIDPVKFEQRIQTSAQGSPANDYADDEAPSPDDGFSQKSHKTNKKPNLLRGVLDRGRSGKPSRKEKEESVASGSRGSTPDMASAADEDMAGGADSSNSNGIREESGPRRWVEYPSGINSVNVKDLAPDEPYKRESFNMYCNLPIYCFFRMFVILYERLLNIKQNEGEVHETIARAMHWKAAIDLKMIDKLPNEFFSDVSENANYYQQILNMFEDQIKGEIDVSQIEETLRRFYLQTGWQLYSFDRLLSALVRFTLGLFTSDSKEKTWDIYLLFKKDRAREDTTHQDELNYRKQVEKYSKDADVYRITFVSPVKLLTRTNRARTDLNFVLQSPPKMEAYVSIFKKDDPTFDVTALDRAKRWRYYLASYSSVDPTEGVPNDKVQLPYLKHSLIKPDESSEEYGALYDTLRSMEKLQFIIRAKDYRIEFENKGDGGVDYTVLSEAIRTGGEEGRREMEALREARSGLAQEKLVMNNAWMRGISRDDVDARKQAFRKDIDLPRAVEVEGDDEEMTDS